MQNIKNIQIFKENKKYNSHTNLNRIKLVVFLIKYKYLIILYSRASVASAKNSDLYNSILLIIYKS